MKKLTPEQIKKAASFLSEKNGSGFRPWTNFVEKIENYLETLEAVEFAVSEVDNQLEEEFEIVREATVEPVEPKADPVPRPRATKRKAGLDG